MGHRDLVNITNVNVVMETYHNGIGNRLSNVNLSTRGSDESEHLPTEFCFLTINPRREDTHKKTVKMPWVKLSIRKKIQLILAGKSAPSTAKSLSSLTRPSEARNISPTQDNNLVLSQGGKLALKDRLTRALFDKAHVCCRCKRKSKGCTPNKTFNGLEKHYTCSKCRDEVNAVNNLFQKQTDVNIRHSDSSRTQMNKERHYQISGGHDKDSGYETVTSNSLVESVCSADTTSASSNQRAGQDVSVTVKSVRKDLVSTRNYNRSQIDSKSQNNKYISYVNSYQYSSQACDTIINTYALTHDLDVANRSESSINDFIRPGQRKLNNYDGYLPDICSKVPYRWETQNATETNNSKNGVQSIDDEFFKVNKSQKNSVGVEGNQQSCHICGCSCKVFFRLPWEGGWMCEDCLDHLN